MAWAATAWFNGGAVKSWLADVQKIFVERTRQVFGRSGRGLATSIT
jgi:hypothetical protein